MHRVMLALSALDIRVFRNQVGFAFYGKHERITSPCTVQVGPGDVVIRQARALKSGLFVGSSDLIGWCPHVITADDVGKTKAIFLACETKAEDGRLTPEQKTFTDAVNAAGGIGIVAESVDEAIEQIERRRR